jgi:hypothetical protein
MLPSAPMYLLKSNLSFRHYFLHRFTFLSPSIFSEHFPNLNNPRAYFPALFSRILSERWATAHGTADKLPGKDYGNVMNDRW